MKAILMLLGLSLVSPAMAQQPAAPSDPRLAQPTIMALQGVLTLREAEVKTCGEDKAAAQAAAEARLETAMEWLKQAQAAGK